MPEIPEMENYKALLNRTVTGKTITGVEVTRPATVNLPPAELIFRVQGRQFREVLRAGKYLVFAFSDGNFLLLHLMLDGWLYLLPPEPETANSSIPSSLPAQVILDIGGAGKLHFCELYLGFLHWHDCISLEETLSGLGADPLRPDFTPEFFSSLLAKRKGAIQPLLINQKAIAGIGNGYSNEILFESGILPDRPAKELAETEINMLFSTIPTVLRKGITAGGYMEHPFMPGDTHTGGMNEKWQVYDRAGKTCYVCGTKIQKNVLSSRNVFFCALCQR